MPVEHELENALSNDGCEFWRRERRTRYKGVRGLWATERALKVLRDELGQAVAAGAGHDARGEEAVRELVWELVEKMLETANEASDGACHLLHDVHSLLRYTC